MNLKPLSAFFFIVAVFVSNVALASREPTAPGTYHDWHDVDEVTIIQPFHAAAYSQIAVESFDSTGVKLPPSNENTFQAVQSAIRVMKPAFIEGLAAKAQRKANAN